VSRNRAEPPVRTCVGCRRSRQRDELVRLALTDDRRRVTLDLRCRLPGRGAYICRDTWPACLVQARKRRGVSRTLRVGDDVIEGSQLEEELRRKFEEATP